MLEELERFYVKNFEGDFFYYHLFKEENKLFLRNLGYVVNIPRKEFKRNIEKGKFKKESQVDNVSTYLR